MHTFLIDTCIWSYWFDNKRQEHTAIINHAQKLPADSILGISIITWGEIAYGQKVGSLEEAPIQSKYVQFITAQRPKSFYIDIHTAKMYGELRALLFNKYTPREKKRVLRPEQLINPVTSKELGIQENDLWIAAQAMARNLILVTSDKLSRIHEVAGDELQIENWTR